MTAPVRAKLRRPGADPTPMADPPERGEADDFKAVADFARRYMTHFNGGTAVRAAEAYVDRLKAGDAMMITLAGAFSTGEGGKWLAEMIRRDKVHAISSTGANIEEDVFNLVGHDDYVKLPRYRDMTPDDEQDLQKKHLNRVTDTAIPDTVMEPVISALQDRWEEADKANEPFFFHEPFYDILNDGTLKDKYQIDPKDSWMIAAAEKNLPIVVPGHADSSAANAFVASCLRGDISSLALVRSDMEYFARITAWYVEETKEHGVGMWVLGGGISADFVQCIAPMVKLDLKRKDAKPWSYLAQIGDSHESLGGFSGCSPLEKMSGWSKLDKDTPIFDMKSDFTLVAPIMAAIILSS